MRNPLIALIPAALIVVAAEAVCRLLLHLSDQAVPLVVFPLTFSVWGLAIAYLSKEAGRVQGGRRGPVERSPR